MMTRLSSGVINSLSFCMVSCLGLSSCSEEPTSAPTTPAQKEAAPPAEVTPKAVAEFNYSKPPTISDERAILKHCLQLADEMEDCSNDFRCQKDDETARYQLIGERVGPWIDREKKFEDSIVAVGKSAMADKTRPNYRVALANENLSYCMTWLWSARDAVSTGKPALAKQYIKASRYASDRAERILSGRFRVDLDDPEKAIIEIPRYIEIADQQTN